MRCTCRTIEQRNYTYRDSLRRRDDFFCFRDAARDPNRYDYRRAYRVHGTESTLYGSANEFWVKSKPGREIPVRLRNRRRTAGRLLTHEAHWLVPFPTENINRPTGSRKLSRETPSFHKWRSCIHGRKGEKVDRASPMARRQVLTVTYIWDKCLKLSI